MITAPKPDHENKRLKALREYRILDTAPEKSFDDLVDLAACLCDTPMAMLSLVDEARQWFKAAVGVRQTETPREVSFCSHAILRREMMVVPDARKDRRFADNPLVTRSPRIRFYAGVPLVNAEGLALGTLCVADHRPRRLTARQRRALKSLSRLALIQMDLRRVSGQLAEALSDLKTLQGLLPICMYCKQIRDDQGCWNQLEEYVSAHTEAHFSHGICPPCAKKHHPELTRER